MKRISDFEDCRMDMKNMAALNGGAASSYSDSRHTVQTPDYPCGDTLTSTCKDDYYTGTDGKRLVYYYDFKCTLVGPPDCGGLKMAINHDDWEMDITSGLVALGGFTGLTSLS